MGEKKILEGVQVDCGVIIRFFNRYVNVMMLFFPLTSFLLVPAIQGTTIIVVMTGILGGIFACVPVGELKFSFTKELVVFFCVVLFLSISSQFINLVYDVRLSKDLVLVNKGHLMVSFYRSSHLTQTLYLVACFTIYLFVKYFSDEKIIEHIYWGLRLLCFYAIYEFIYYFLTGRNGDFIVNREFSGGGSASLFQTKNIAGFQLLRMKGYTGEPSMFAFTIIPFWILSFGLKRRFDSILLLVCMILTFSTTAYLAICLFTFFWFFYKKKYKQLVFFGLLVLLLMFALQMDAFRSVMDNLYDSVFGNKISGESASSKQRSGTFYTHLEYWSGLNGFSQLFGVGFGYIRSTDFLTTVLVNNGILGFILFSVFILKNIFIKVSQSTLSWCYKMGLFLLYFVMMATVPEFAYPSFWIYLAVGAIMQARPENVIAKTK